MSQVGVLQHATTPWMRDNKQARHRYAMPSRYTPLVPRPEGGALVTILPSPERETEQACRNVPTSVYRYYDKNHVLLYVGVTSRGISRNIEHNKSKEWFGFVTRQLVEHFASRHLALQRETHLIKTFRPPFNKQQNPGHELTRCAYLTVGVESLTPAPTPNAAANAFPKTLRFQCVQAGDEIVRLFLTTALPIDASVLPIPSGLPVRDAAKRKVGVVSTLTLAGHGGANLHAKISTDGRPPLMFVDVGVKWPPPGRSFQVLNAKAHFYSAGAAVGP